MEKIASRIASGEVEKDAATGISSSGEDRLVPEAGGEWGEKKGEHIRPKLTLLRPRRKG